MLLSRHDTTHQQLEDSARGPKFLLWRPFIRTCGLVGTRRRLPKEFLDSTHMEWGSSHQYRSIHLLKWDPTERGLAWLNPRDCQVPRLTSTHTFAISSSTPAIHWYFRSSPSWLRPILLQSVVHALHSWRQWYQTCKASSICHSCWSRLLWLGVHMFFLARVII